MAIHLTHSGDHPDDTGYYKSILHELVEMAADLARIAHHQAKRQAEREAEAAAAAIPPIPAANDRFPDPNIAFDRIARVIRRTIALARQLEEPPKRPTTKDATPDRIAARKRILRRVEDIIHRNAKPADAAPLRAELRERLDAPDLEDDIDARPVADIIEDILHDLHLSHSAESWRRRTPADIETLRTQAAAIPQTWIKREIDNPPPAARPRSPPPKRMFHIRA